MIDVKAAVSKANEYLKMFFPDASNIQLEEVELNNEDGEWLITLSLPDNEAMPIGIFPRIRKYKLFRIDARDGAVIAMKIREIK
jgi:hypothetical protein